MSLRFLLLFTGSPRFRPTRPERRRRTTGNGGGYVVDPIPLPVPKRMIIRRAGRWPEEQKAFDRVSLGSPHQSSMEHGVSPRRRYVYLLYVHER